MQARNVQFKPDAKVVPCPQCGNKTHFTIHSDQCAEDYCEVWAACQCGHQPSSADRLEDVMGGLDDENVLAAISCWNDSMTRVA